MQPRIVSRMFISQAYALFQFSMAPLMPRYSRYVKIGKAKPWANHVMWRTHNK